MELEFQLLCLMSDTLYTVMAGEVSGRLKSKVIKVTQGGGQRTRSYVLRVASMNLSFRRWGNTG